MIVRLAFLPPAGSPPGSPTFSYNSRPVAILAGPHRGIITRRRNNGELRIYNVLFLCTGS